MWWMTLLSLLSYPHHGKLSCDALRCAELVALVRDEAAQVESESKSCKHFIIFQFQTLRSRCFQRGFDRVNLHRPTRIIRCQCTRSRGESI